MTFIADRVAVLSTHNKAFTELKTWSELSQSFMPKRKEPKITKEDLKAYWRAKKG